METITNLQQQLGLMSWPLLICSAITLTLLLERFVQLLLFTRLGPQNIHQLLGETNAADEQQLNKLAADLSGRRALMSRGVLMLIRHRRFQKPLREDAAGMWLQQKRQQLRTGLKLLALIGVLSPLIGLLGTVIGLIEMFKAVAQSSGSITPNDLADGLGIAMRTTAAGLIVALPAISGAQLLGLWADKVISKLEHSLNYCNLWMEGITLTETAADKKNVLQPTVCGEQAGSQL
ncbi:MotA/TolQ/ExbB proton channel family protein [Psychromonas ossibalaenae]|uniref:MotA/TolQ/ExbB proton channel family protein n=1 Tax=Psychromonas ossibalaenae TaxID=444922 RepID=UPI0003792B56|nr:MotA/TolQ/ExbB proton channel family protein [Psychromonas ossibalaenae]